MSKAPTPPNRTQPLRDASAGSAIPPGAGGVPLSRELLRFAWPSALAITLFTLISEPIGVWPLAFVCLVPWGIVVYRTHRAWVVHWGSFLFGWLFFLVNLKWLMPVTGLGYAALAFYLAIYWTLAAWAMRTGRRYRITAVVALPTTWVACEFLRGCVMSGFPWTFISHALHEQITLIQISDLTGAYGVTFIAAMVNGWIIDAFLAWKSDRLRGRKRRAIIAGGVATVAVIIAACVYGRFRISEAQLEDGPRIAVLQEDFPLSNTPPYGDPPQVVFSRYMALAGRAAHDKPDIISFPETVWSFPQNIDFLELELPAVDGVAAPAWSQGKLFHEATSALARGDYAAVNRVIDWLERSSRPELLARQPGGRLPRLPDSGGPPVTVLLGSVSLEVQLDATPRSKRYNSALLYDRNGVQRRQRYDKSHLVPFGESVPFRDSKLFGISLRPLYLLLNSLVPFSNGGREEFSLWPGRHFHVFEVDVSGRMWRFGVPICYEDVMPYVSRRFVWDGPNRRSDFLINISNDGWFLHSAELPQHLAICTFRAVENRVGIARAVNTGISGFIDPLGRKYELVTDGSREFGPGIVGHRTATVKIDRRTSVYGRFGDWFAFACVVFSSILWLGGIVTRWIFALQQRIAAWGRRGSAGRRAQGGTA